MTNVSPDSGQHAWCPSWPLLSYGCGGDDDRIPGAAPVRTIESPTRGSPRPQMSHTKHFARALAHTFAFGTDPLRTSTSGRNQ